MCSFQHFLHVNSFSFGFAITTTTTVKAKSTELKNFPRASRSLRTGADLHFEHTQPMQIFSILRVLQSEMPFKTPITFFDLNYYKIRWC